MVSRIINFNKTGYDPFIDFLKAYCILVVIFCHGFPYLQETGYCIWGVQIPLFILIQVFHCYKRDPKPINWIVIVKRIVIPFLVIEMLLLILKIWKNDVGLNILIIKWLEGGGYGPGSYYPWVYLQMTILIPLMRPICEYLGKWRSLLFFILICEAIEIICSITDMPDSIYRLLCLRYVMLIWFGWIWIKDGVKLNAGTIIASLISLYAIVYLVYFEGDYEPWLYNTGWVDHRWICYFWVSWLFTGVLYKLYLLVCKFERIMLKLKLIAAASYEIFLIQMMYYTVVKFSYFSIIGNGHVQYVVYFVMAFVMSIFGGVWMLKIEKSIYN